MMFSKLRVLTGILFMAVMPATAQTVDELIEKNLAAHGGKDKIKAVQSVKMTGKMKMMGGIEAPLNLQLQRPNMLRMEMTIQGMQMVQAFDGQTAWAIIPFTGSADPRVLSDEESKDIKMQADMDGQLVDYQEKGHKVELVGKEDVDGTEAYKLKLTLKDGTVLFMFLDAETFLEFRMSGKETKDGNDIQFEANLGDFKKVGEDLIYPYSMETKINGQVMGNMTFETIELNAPIDASIFKMPAPKPAEGK